MSNPLLKLSVTRRHLVQEGSNTTCNSYDRHDTPSENLYYFQNNCTDRDLGFSPWFLVGVVNRDGALPPYN